MPSAWFLAQSERYTDPDYPVAYRHAIWLRWMSQILAQGGTFYDEEGNGSEYVVKVVNVTQPLINQISGDPGVTKLPIDDLNSTFAGLTTNQKNSVRAKITSMGDITTTEWDTKFPGDLGQYTLRQVLNFVLGRRKQPRYNSGTDTITWTGTQETPLSVETIDR